MRVIHDTVRKQASPKWLMKAALVLVLIASSAVCFEPQPLQTESIRTEVRLERFASKRTVSYEKVRQAKTITAFAAQGFIHHLRYVERRIATKLSHNSKRTPLSKDLKPYLSIRHSTNDSEPSGTDYPRG